jgi:hypothetical protein
MGRQAKLRQKGGYWASDAGGKTTYFGKVTEVSHAAAMCKLHEHLATANTVPKLVVDVQPGVHLTVNDLAERFLNWVLCHRGRRHTRNAAAICNGSGTPSETCLPWK